KRSIYETTAKYQKIGAQVDKIALQLDKQKTMLLEDNKMLTQLYEQNLDYYKALNIYIAAGELRIEELENEIIPNALKEAEETPDQMLVQKVNDLNQYLNRLDKRVHDLRVTRQITLQQAPQIRLIQNTNQALAERIQTSINTAIPLWKNQIVISLTLLRKQDAVESRPSVSSSTLILDSSTLASCSFLISCLLVDCVTFSFLTSFGASFGVDGCFRSSSKSSLNNSSTRFTSSVLSPITTASF